MKTTFLISILTVLFCGVAQGQTFNEYRLHGGPGMTVEKRVGNHHFLTFVPAVEGGAGGDEVVSDPEVSDLLIEHLHKMSFAKSNAADFSEFAREVSKIWAANLADMQDASQIADQASAEVYDQTMHMLVGDKACAPEYGEMIDELRNQFNDALISRIHYEEQWQLLRSQYCSN